MHLKRLAYNSVAYTQMRLPTLFNKANVSATLINLSVSASYCFDACNDNCEL